MNIGVFDSGFGGLDVLMGIKSHPALIEYDFMYLGDNARVPYGNKSQETIYRYTQEALTYLFSQNCQIVIIACNTASARALRRIQQEWLPKHYPERRVLGVIIPACEEVAAHSFSSVAVLGTESTVDSGSYIEELLKHAPKTRVVQQACPLFVPLIEHGETDEAVWEKYVEQYLRPVSVPGTEAIILGCTHYGIIESRIRAFLSKTGKSVEIINQAHVVADALATYIQRHPEHREKLTKNGKLSYFVTDDPTRFNNLAQKYFQIQINAIRVSL